MGGINKKMADLNSTMAAIAPVLYVVMWTMLIGIISLGFWFVKRQLDYKYYAIVQHVDNSTATVKNQNIVRIRRKNKEGKMHLKKFKEWIDIPEPKFWIPHNKTHAVFLQWDGKRLFSPTDIKYNQVITMTAAEYDAVEDLAKRIENAKVRHGLVGHWEKFGMYYMVFFIVIAHIFALMMLTDVASERTGGGVVQGGVQQLTAGASLWLMNRQSQL